MADRLINAIADADGRAVVAALKGMPEAQRPTRRRTPVRKLLEELHAQAKDHEPELLLAARIRRAQRWIG